MEYKKYIYISNSLIWIPTFHFIPKNMNTNELHKVWNSTPSQWNIEKTTLPPQQHAILKLNVVDFTLSPSASKSFTWLEDQVELTSSKVGQWNPCYNKAEAQWTKKKKTIEQAKHERKEKRTNRRLPWMYKQIRIGGKSYSKRRMYQLIQKCLFKMDMRWIFSRNTHMNKHLCHSKQRWIL